ncbi:hypothetical protein OUZ56_033462 [Daphnia magna]|uniref:Uncharacterized protein n=1 Tax=Daphnia magna TaxID=35525 RepID=A0ABQ9ZYS3_9CRUS|nr:hypothetical protein OUZ56_033462 [Daphnia magna]
MKHHRPVSYMCWLKRLKCNPNTIPRRTFYRLRQHVVGRRTSSVETQNLNLNRNNVGEGHGHVAQDTTEVDDNEFGHEILGAVDDSSSDGNYLPLAEGFGEFSDNDDYPRVGDDGIGPMKMHFYCPDCQSYLGEPNDD